MVLQRTTRGFSSSELCFFDFSHLLFLFVSAGALDFSGMLRHNEQDNLYNLR